MKTPIRSHQPGPGLKVMPRERGAKPWYGPGYCGICGHRDTDDEYSPLIPQPVRWYDQDDGWKYGVLCLGCGEEAAARGPKAGDYAVATGKVALEGTSGTADAIDTLHELGDEDGTYAEVQDLAACDLLRFAGKSDLTADDIASGAWTPVVQTSAHQPVLPELAEQGLDPKPIVEDEE